MHSFKLNEWKERARGITSIGTDKNEYRKNIKMKRRKKRAREKVAETPFYQIQRTCLCDIVLLKGGPK